MGQPKFQNLDDLLAADESRQLAEAKAQIAAGQKAWEALPESQKQAILKNREQKQANFAAEVERKEGVSICDGCACELGPDDGTTTENGHLCDDCAVEESGEEDE